MMKKPVCGHTILIAIFILLLAVIFAASMPFIYRTGNEIVQGDMTDLACIHNDFETSYMDAFPARTQFIDINGLLARVMQKRELNDVYRLRGGSLGVSYAYYDMTDAADSVANLRDYLQSHGIETVFMLIPAKEAMPDGQLPAGAQNASPRIVAEMRELLAARGVCTLDLPAMMREAGMTASGDYYRTDHHWCAETALWATERLMTLLHEEYGIPYDPALYDLSNYDVDAYPKSFLGSRGRRTGALYGGVDDFNLLHPKFDTQLQLDIWKKISAAPAGSRRARPPADLHREGSFYDVNIFEKYLQRDGYYLEWAFSAYLDSNFALVRHHNENAPAPQHLVLLKDSFGRAVDAFISLQFKDVDAIDPRAYKSHRLAEEIVRMEPDVVVLCFYTGAYQSSGFFDYGLAESAE